MGPDVSDAGEIMIKMSPREFAEFILKLKDEDIGRYYSGGYSIEKRKWFTEMIRVLAQGYVR